MTRDTRCSHLPSHRNAHTPLHRDVQIVNGRYGTKVYKLGPTFAEPTEAVKQDPGPELVRELERQIAARRQT